MRTKDGVPGPLSILHSGIPSFMHAPLVPAKKEQLRKMVPGVAILGAPLEMAPSMGLPGASLGPRAIRLGSEAVSTYNAELDTDINDHLSVVDCGDVQPVVSNVVKTHERIQSAVTQILEAGLLPVVLGGDHSIPIPCVRAFHEFTKGKIGIIHFDAHSDISDNVDGFKQTNVSPIRRALDLKRVSGKNIVQIGIRGNLSNLESRKATEKAGIKVFYRQAVFERGIRDVTEEAIEIASDGTDAVYLTFDIDCLDGAHAPATSVPGVGGLTSIEAIIALRAIGKTGIVKSFDLVEVGNPATDPNNLTGRAAATMIVEFLAATTLSKS